MFVQLEEINAFQHSIVGKLRILSCDVVCFFHIGRDTRYTLVTIWKWREELHFLHCREEIHRRQGYINNINQCFTRIVWKWRMYPLPTTVINKHDKLVIMFCEIVLDLNIMLAKLTKRLKVEKSWKTLEEWRIEFEVFVIDLPIT